MGACLKALYKYDLPFLSSIPAVAGMTWIIEATSVT